MPNQTLERATNPHKVFVGLTIWATGITVGMMNLHDVSAKRHENIVQSTQSLSITVPVPLTTYQTTIPLIKANQVVNFQPPQQTPAAQIPATEPPIIQDTLTELPSNAPQYEAIEVKRGDSLSLIFQRKQLSGQVLHEIMSLGDEVNTLKHLRPGDQLRFNIEDGDLKSLEYDLRLDEILQVSKTADSYSVNIINAELDTKLYAASGIINDSLFLAAQAVGLSDNITMQLIGLFGWDIDFALEVRKGDKFHVIYEKHYRDGVLAHRGRILAAEFINRGKSFKAVRYQHPDGYSRYYSENGHSMRKAFLRTPVKFSRISSHFNPYRKHPILNRIRAHRGVDYAAPTGTSIRAAGDGVVKLAANKGGYGKTVIIQHGGNYSTLYGHLSRYSKNIKRGKSVQQGQIIGYVGSTGLATGPHLHYEFQINGQHHNPLTVKLPKETRISDSLLNNFKHQTEPLLARLDAFSQGTAKVDNDGLLLLSMGDGQAVPYHSSD